MAKNILKEAIADAKAVREVALANAKAALEEAFTPKLQSMLSAKLSETLNEEEEELEENYMDEEMDETMDETYMDEEMDEIAGMDEETSEGADLDEEIDLEEILNELELEEGEDSKEETVDEAKDTDEETMDEAKDDEDLEEAVGYPNHRADQVQKVKADATDVNQGLNEGESFDLDALLEEINNLDETENEINEEDEVNEGMFDGDPDTTLSDKLRSLAKSADSYGDWQAKAKEAGANDAIINSPRWKALVGENMMEAELAETKAALETVTTELNEVNLLNSKLLYVNRIFKANTLDEGQKLRVVETLDKAETAKEAKLIYETIKDTFTVANNKKTSFKNKTKSLKEGIGMASKAAGTSTAPKKEIISESTNMISRFQKLANIKIN